MAQGFDPLAKEDGKTEWEVLEDCDCPSIDNVAEAQTTDIDTLKKACETQLKRKGIDVGVFVVNGSRAYFKQCTREEALAAKKSQRMVKAVKDEGMPTYKNPLVHGNLFLILT